MRTRSRSSPTNSVCGEDLPDLLALAVRIEDDVAPFDGFEMVTLVMFRSGTRVVARRHGKAVGDHVCSPRIKMAERGRPPPTTPETMANVVTPPSIAP